MFSGRQKLLGALIVGTTAVLVGYAVARTFSGPPPEASVAVAVDGGSLSTASGSEANAATNSAEGAKGASTDAVSSGPGAPGAASSLANIGAAVGTGAMIGAQGGPTGTGGSNLTAPGASLPGDAATGLNSDAGASVNTVAERPKNRVYIVQPGDNFYDIARKVYGRAGLMNKLVAANVAHKTLHTGMRIICPAFDGSEFKLDLPLVDDAGVGPATGTGEGAGAAVASSAEHTPAGKPHTAATEVVSAGGEHRTHVVQSGENLYDIAKKYYHNGSDWTRIASANPSINPKTIRAGQTLVIP